MIWFSIFVLSTQQPCSLFRCLSLTTAHRNPIRVGCRLGVGVAGAAQILVERKKVWYASEKRMRCQRQEERDTWHLNWNGRSSGSSSLYSLEHLYPTELRRFSSSLGIWRWIFAFRAQNWLNLGLARKGYLAGYYPLCCVVWMKVW